jgi:hypothetical protein
LIVTQGPPDYAPIDGTQLLFVSNTTGNVFKYLGDQKSYVLVSGRWFASSSLNGPWENVPNDQLPADFAKIPNESEKENIKASVAGTEQAQEALEENSIPQTAKVVRNKAKLTAAKCDGSPEFEPIEETTLQSAVNCSRPLIMVTPDNYYTLENGVWFLASSVNGPWVVADSIPPALYTIPPRHPLHYVTYVRVYGATPEYVYVGYTPGYYGSYIGRGVVVYGTGYYYRPWARRYWYGPPVTYGFGTSIGYSPWTGWGWGFGYGWRWSSPTVVVGWGWGCHPWWGPYRYYRPGPYRWYGYNHSVYRRWNGRTVVVARAVARPTWQSRTALAYNSHTGRIAAGQRASVTHAFASNPRTSTPMGHAPMNAGSRAVAKQHATNSKLSTPNNNWNRNNNIYGTREGRTYRPGENGTWEHHVQGNKWESEQDANQIKSLDNERNARLRGEERSEHLSAPSDDVKTPDNKPKPDIKEPKKPNEKDQKRLRPNNKRHGLMGR